jgi:hypothetical protein
MPADERTAQTIQPNSWSNENRRRTQGIPCRNADREVDGRDLGVALFSLMAIALISNGVLPRKYL